jgi:hypothetical protein
MHLSSQNGNPPILNPIAQFPTAPFVTQTSSLAETQGTSSLFPPASTFPLCMMAECIYNPIPTIGDTIRKKPG